MAVKHRTKILDLGFVTILVAAAALFAFEFDVFATEGAVSRARETLELDEVLLLATLVVLCILGYTWRRAVEHQRESQRRSLAEKEILRLALQDPLTGLPNRRQFDEALKTALQAVPAAPEAHALFMLDLNGFKRINDLHGHPVGDEVLIHVGARLLAAVRENDLVARLGGDEFAVLARNVSGPEGATNIARRIIDCLQKPVTAGGGVHTIGAGIGIALSPQDSLSADELMRKADVALYRAKSHAQSDMRFFEPEMDARLREREMIETALRRAIDEDLIGLRFKPALDGRTGRVTAFEALPHWSDADLGHIPADRFWPIAEEAGLVAALTDNLLRRACAAAGAWPQAVRLGFYVTAAQLKSPTFGVRLLATLAASKLAPTRLDLEVDEGVLIRDTETTAPILKPLRAAGVSVAAVHFGTGYSDLQNLHRLELDRIKLDPTFVGAMLHDRKAATMVRALIGIGRGMNIAVSADGVVDPAQKSILLREGCQEIQGQVSGGVVDADEALSLVETPKRVKRRA